MSAVYVFFASLCGLFVLFSLKIREMKVGGKSFSVLRYKLDIFLHHRTRSIKNYYKYLNKDTFRLLLVFLTAKFQAWVILGAGKLKSTKIFQMIQGKIAPKGTTSAVSSFLKDVAEYKEEIIKVEEEKKQDIIDSQLNENGVEGVAENQQNQ
jgi:hypothetical protein